MSESTDPSMEPPEPWQNDVSADAPDVELHRDQTPAPLDPEEG